ncbi:aldose epimerase family protein [Bacillus sp. KH172YL63]|uniref:aldose epimerase family protein n=1 Tax=Bacillus sp. KH172YL63 TaxID=2709784 RepID=UPI0013E43BC6|nr:aldose epimerase family protein [Bacillus sp. KH172YL63]BCB02520.1 aldose 1-epimerase [Bacillus sp. KH172YL63]
MKIETYDLENGWTEYTLSHEDMSVSLLNYGGIITKWMVPDREGKVENIVLGYKDIQDYRNDPAFLGAVIGPVAGRIQGASFEIEGTPYHLEANDGVNHLHGGSNGFHKVLWQSEPFHGEDRAGIRLTHCRSDLEGGYPGTLNVSVTYTLTDANEFIIDYEAQTSHTTPLTMTNHTYFNLHGDRKDTIHQHTVSIDSHQILQLDADLIPTGTIIDTNGSPFDYREGRTLREGMTAGLEQTVIAGNGFDHYFLLDHECDQSIVVKDDTSGRVMTVKTDQPGFILYTGNNLPDDLPLSEGPSSPYGGVCFEAQGSPASLHHDGLPGIILRPEDTYKQRTVFRFSTD